MSLLDQEAFLINISDMTRFNHFNLIAPIYDKLFKPSDPRKLQSLLGLEKHINLLDVGGGTGRGSHNLHEFINKLVIADSSMGMLAQAQKKESTMPILSMSEELSLKSESR